MNPKTALVLGGKTSTKDLIISILSSEWPLTAKQIHHRINREEGKSISYQAVHKLLQELNQEKIVEKKEKNYTLNMNWIKQVKRYAENLEKSYELDQKNVLEELNKKGSINLTFPVATEVARLLIFDLMRFPNPKKKPMIILTNLVWSPVGLSGEEMAGLKKNLRETQCYSLAREDNLMGRIYSAAYRRFGVKIKIGVNYTMRPETIVVGDYIGEIYWPPAFVSGWRRMMAPSKVTDISIKKMFELMHDFKGKFHIIINKNAEVADLLREQTLTYFKEAKK